MEPYILIAISAIWFVLGYIFSDSRKKKFQSIYQKGYEVRYLNKSNEYETATIWDNASEHSKFLIVKKQSEKYTPVYIIKQESVVQVTPIDTNENTK